MDFTWSNSQQLQDRIIWVRSQAEAENYPMIPNATMQFWDMYQPVIYLKRTDAYGRTALFEIYDLTKRENVHMMSAQQTMVPAQNQQQTPNDYVSVTAFNGLADQVSHINDMLASVMETLKHQSSLTAQQQNQNAQQSHQDRRKDGNR